jgi:Amt family ammonium transporter
MERKVIESLAHLTLERNCLMASTRISGGAMEALKSGSDVLFILLGGIMVLAMHSGFAFLELGTVRKKSQVNALVKILTDFSVSTIAYFFVGYSIAYGVNFFAGAETLVQKNGFELTKFFFLLTFAAAIPAIVSGGIAERARFYPQLAATFLIVGFIYPSSRELPGIRPSASRRG